MKGTEVIMLKLLPYLRCKKAAYEAEGISPTLARLIKDLEKKV